MKVISKPLSPVNFVDSQAGVTICQRQEEEPAGSRDGENHKTSNPGAGHALASKSLTSCNMSLRAGSFAFRGLLICWICVKDEFDKGSRDQARRQMSGKVVMEEELTSHKVEWEVMSSPSQPEEAGGVVQPGTGAFDQELARRLGAIDRKVKALTVV